VVGIGEWSWHLGPAGLPDTDEPFHCENSTPLGTWAYGELFHWINGSRNGESFGQGISAVTSAHQFNLADNQREVNEPALFGAHVADFISNGGPFESSCDTLEDGRGRCS
jgi:hypothetical protein